MQFKLVLYLLNQQLHMGSLGACWYCCVPSSNAGQGLQSLQQGVPCTCCSSCTPLLKGPLWATTLLCTSFHTANPPQNFQILQIKFLCLQCFSSFLQYKHISELPLNTIIVHLASNYSNRKTGNHCHSDCGKSMLHRGISIHPMECLLS